MSMLACIDSPPRSLVHFFKTCACAYATASTGVVRSTGMVVSREDGTTHFTFEFIPGPSCDVCGKPWKRFKEMA